MDRQRSLRPHARLRVGSPATRHQGGSNQSARVVGNREAAARSPAHRARGHGEGCVLRAREVRVTARGRDPPPTRCGTCGTNEARLYGDRTGRALSSVLTAAPPGTGTQRSPPPVVERPRGGLLDRGALSRGARWRPRIARSSGSLLHEPTNSARTLRTVRHGTGPPHVRVHQRRDPRPRQRDMQHPRRSVPRTPMHRSVSRRQPAGSRLRRWRSPVDHHPQY